MASSLKFSADELENAVEKIGMPELVLPIRTTLIEELSISDSEMILLAGSIRADVPSGRAVSREKYIERKTFMNLNSYAINNA